MLTSTVEITWDFLDPLFLGSDASSDRVFAQFDLALGGRGYMIDWLDESLSGPSSIPMLAQQQDNGERPGERSLSREDLWPRTFTSFHHGAGQRWADRSDSDPLRFWASKGVDVWTKDQLTLLKTTSQKVATATAGEMVGLIVSGNALLHYFDNGVWKVAAFDATDALVGGSSGTVTTTGGGHHAFQPYAASMATDGLNVYVIDGVFNNDTVYKASSGGTTAAVFVTPPTQAAALGFAHGRLIVAGGTGGRQLYDITTGASTAFGGLLQDVQEHWVCFAEGVSVIYGATNTYGNRQSHIYKVTYDPTSATLGAPSIAGLIPVGEQIVTLYGYLGFLFVGTDKGFRMCRQATDGTLEVGPLIPIAGGVYSFCAIEQFVYFGWSNFDSTSAGIGRIDISVFTDNDLVPAYASDLMAPVAGTVRALTALDNSNASFPDHRPWFTVTGTSAGLYVEHPTDFETTGTLDTGLFGFDLSADKDLMAVDLHTEALNGSVAVSVAAGEGSFNSVDLHSVSGSVGMFMPTRHIPGDRFEIRLTLTRGSTTTAPVVTSTSALAWPAPQRGKQGILPLLLYSETLDATGYPMEIDIWDQIAFIGNLVVPGIAPTQLQLGSESFLVHITDYQTVSVKKSDEGGLEATVRVQWKNLDRSLT